MAIRPTFSGFEMARSALVASQKNIDVTGQNIANINTEGYSRQRVNLSAVGAGGINWKHGLQPWENIGYGVHVDDIKRMRDEFLDVRFWKESNDNARYCAKADVLVQVEELLDETMMENVHTILSDFYDALQELNDNADEVDIASMSRMVAQTLTRTLNKISSDLTDIKTSAVTQLELTKDLINHTAKALSDINIEIRNQTLTGVVSNELLDQRNILLDQLSGFGNITVSEDIGGGISVYFGNGGIDDDIMLVNGVENEYFELEFDAESDDPYRLTWADNGSEVIVKTGSLFGYYEMLNGTGEVSMLDDEDTADIATKGIPFFMNMLDTFASEFADEFNSINEGDALFDSTDGAVITAATIRISQEWTDDPQYIIRSTIDSDYNAGANDNVARFLNALKAERQIGDNFVGSFQQYISSLNSEIAIEVNYNDRLLATSDSLLLSISDLRDSVMGVSEDEEAMNLARFQKSYNAAARFMTTLDEMLETIILKLGIVGR